PAPAAARGSFAVDGPRFAVGSAGALLLECGILTWGSILRSVQSRPVRRNLLAALVVFLVSFGIRAWFVGSTQHHPISDARHYERRAQHILEHGAMPDGAYRTPAYPYFLASIVKVAGPGWRAPAMANAAM